MIGFLASVLLLASAAAPSTDAAAVLPDPPPIATGEVPLSRPIAPIPPGLADWSVSLSLLGGVADPFYGKIATIVSARKGFGALGLELFGGKAFSWASPAIDICTNASSCTSPSGTKVGAAPGNIGFLAGAAGVWRAAEGKVSLAGLGNRQFALDMSAGVAALQYTVTENTTRTSTVPAGRLGLAVEGEVIPSLALRVELQDLIYPTTIRNENSVQNQMLIGAAVAWRWGGR